MTLPRMRTAQGVLDEIKAHDPESEVSLHYIRNIIKQNAIPVVSVGRKKLVDIDQVLEFLAKGNASPVPCESKLRRVRV